MAVTTLGERIAERIKARNGEESAAGLSVVVGRARTTTKLAPRDRLVREIQKVLKLVKPDALLEPGEAEYTGYCGVGAEVYLYFAGGRKANLKVMQHSYEGGSHWWLLDSKGRVIDLTLGYRDHLRLSKNPDELYRYEEGKPAMFRNGYERPSKRAKALILLVEARRAGKLPE
jgi:hypothetical protein